jgi:hypothetical protein
MASPGADAWLGNDFAEENDSRQEADDFFKSIDWHAVTRIASAQRDQITCELSEKFSMGTNNLVRRLIFADGVSR